jgi:spermidine synthase
MELWYTEQHTDNVRFSILVDQQLYQGQSEFQRIDVFHSKEFGKFFTLDGLMMVTEKDEFIYHDMIVHVPMATNPDIKRVLVIGAGDGGTVRELCRYPHIEHIDMVEIDKLVVDVCLEFFPTTTVSLHDPRVHIFYEDGLKFVRSRVNEYDLIIVDSTDPFGPGEGLFTREFYGNCYHALKENGISGQSARKPLLRYLSAFHETCTYAHQGVVSDHPRVSGTYPDVSFRSLVVWLCPQRRLIRSRI